MNESRQKFCQNQIRRLIGLDFFPTDELARGELAKALFRASQSNSHAERIIDAALQKGFGDNARACPTPFELADLASTINPDERRPAASATCPHCFGTGWARTAIIATEGAFAGQKYDAVKPCSCRRHLRAVS